MPTCCVSGCKSGYKNCEEKRHFFQVPVNVERQISWKEKIGRDDLKCTQYVCDKHFNDDEIERKKELLSSDGIVLGTVSKYNCKNYKT